MPIPARLLATALVALLAVTVAAAVALAGTPRAKSPAPPSVRFIYLVSADRPVRADYRRAIERAARDVQALYARALGGLSFRLAPPIVEVLRSDKPAAWFYGNPTRGRADDSGFYNALDEVHRLLGAERDPAQAWVIYSDGPGNKGRAVTGVAVLPEDDLLGLVGAHPTQPDAGRWVAGLAHELGHALGLPHPPADDATPGAIMGAGFYDCYPDRCRFTAAGQEILRASPFIALDGLTIPR